MADRGIFRSRGEPLDASLRRMMEPRLGMDLSGVQIHRGDTADAATRAVNARAFAVGRDVAFAAGEFRPDTRAGQHLIAHELAHVAQQERSGTTLLQRQPKPTTPAWQDQLDEILPKKKMGLIGHMHRIMQLTDLFSDAELLELTGLIRADADAKKLTQVEAGVPGIVALHATRSGQHLDVAAARSLLGLINADPVALKFVRDEAGMPGIIALHETRIGDRLDVIAARLLLDRFPASRKTPRKSEETKPEVFAEDVVRQAFIRFHYNAFLHGKDEAPLAGVPDVLRQNCIAIVHDLAPKLFTDPDVTKKLDKEFERLRKKSVTYTMVHTGDALTSFGVAGKRVDLKFFDAAGKKTNGNTEPTRIESSPWEKVMDAVGNDYGWHVFGVAIMDGYHSVTLFVDNQPDGKTLYWADQWRIDPGDDFKEVKGSVSGFRKYEKAGFDTFIQEMTNTWWNKVHSSTSKCAENHPKDWDSKCRYDATFMFWHMRKVVQKP